MSDDPFDLQRFVDAQAGVYEQALAELVRGAKSSHWMWFVFPQIEGLGASPMAQRYAIGSAEEARAYLAHPLLGSRLVAATEAACGHASLGARALFGAPDDLKFRSSLTLFTAVAPTVRPFGEALCLFFAGEPDPRTLDRLA